MKTINLILILALLFVLAPPVLAQGVEVPHVVATTKPVLPEVRAAVDELLAASPPIPDVTAYVITYAKSHSNLFWRVSVAAADPYTEDWHLEDAKWWGSMELSLTGDGYDAQYSASAFPNRVAKVAAPSLNGGSSSVRFPWSSGKSALYGDRGVHGGAFGTSGMVAVDWVGGNDMGSNVMTDSIYASDSGTVDAVCEDGTSVGIRTYNSTTGEYFAYLHLNDNANLEEAHAFSRGAYIGSLRHGSFDDTCGWADQQDDHYHVHWGVMPASGKYTTEGCTLDTGTDIWDCGDDEVSPGEMMYGGGGSGSGTDDPAEGAAELSFWDFLLTGALGLFQAVILPILPEHEDIAFLESVINGIVALFAVAYIITKGSYTLYPAYLAIGAILFIKAFQAVIIIAVTIMRFIKSIPGVP